MIEKFIGKTLKSVSYVDKFGQGDTLTFEFTDGSIYEMYHEQDCCESVSLESWSQEEIKRLEGQKIIHAYESENGANTEYGSCTWTFYTIASEKDTATLRWYGESNGHYSESVSIRQTQEAMPKSKPSRFELEAK